MVLMDLRVLWKKECSPENDAYEQIEYKNKQKEMKSIKEYIEKNYSKRITLENLASEFFIDKSYMCILFKKQYGITVNGYLIQIRIREAKRMMCYTDKSMEEIASAIGVNGAAYFSRLFKKIEGSSPREYSKRYRR